MIDAAAWERSNERYLAAALVWLRLRLRLGQARPASEAAQPALPAPGSSTSAHKHAEARRRWMRPSPPPSGAAADQLQRALEAMATAESIDPAPALVILARRFGLTDFERDLLLLCVAMELDPSLAALCGTAQGDPRVNYPTFALALTVFDRPSWEPLLPDRPLRHYGLIEIYQPPGIPLTSSALRADERVVSFAKGVTYVDDRLVPFLVPLDRFPTAATTSPRSQAALTDRLVRELERSAADELVPVVQLLGADGASKQQVAWQVTERLGLRLYRLPSELLPTEAGELERLARLWERETILVPIALYLETGDVDTSRERQAVQLTRFLARSGGVLFLDTGEVLPSYGRPSLVMDVPQPTAAEQEAAWRRTLGPSAAEASAQLAGQFDLGIPAIERIGQAARSLLDERPLAERVWAVSLIETRKGLDALAQRIEAKATWDDIVLPDAELRLLRRIAEQVRQRALVYQTWGFAEKTTRGLGINALFSGPSGTGKTMAAEVIAHHLRLNLYRIDLSAVVSKYIGETEKNLARLFREAEAGGVVLFFDEADALFGKRSEVRDSHDRYANVEISYLLQRMEAYKGLAILATNMKSALDPAFVRRLRFVVSFPYPGPVERRRIWAHIFPKGTRTERLDLDRLASLNFTGGNIFTIAINAAFLAAADGTAVTMEHVMEAARAETRKLERPVDEREFLVSEVVSA